MPAVRLRCGVTTPTVADLDPGRVETGGRRHAAEDRRGHRDPGQRIRHRGAGDPSSGVLPRTLPETSGFVSDVTTHLRSPPTWLTTTVMIRFKTISGRVRV